MHSHVNGSLEVYYIDSSNNIKHKTFINVPLEGNNCVSQNVQSFYIHITAKNNQIRQRKRQSNDSKPLEYPLRISKYNKTDYFDNYYIDIDTKVTKLIWFSPRSTKKRLLFDGLFRIKLIYKQKIVLKYMVDNIISHYTKEFHMDSCLNDLIFNYYDNTHDMDPYQSLHRLFAKHNPTRLSHVMVPSKALNDIRRWLRDINIVQYDTDDESSEFDEEEHVHEGKPALVSESTDVETEITTYCDETDEELDESNVWQRICNRHKDDQWYYSTGNEMVVNELDYDLKYKLSHKKLTSRYMRKKSKLQHDRYRKHKKKRRNKYRCINVDGIRLKIKSTESTDKYPKKEYAVKQHRRIARSDKDSKRNQRATNRLLKVSLIDDNVDAIYWSVPPYEFV